MILRVLGAHGGESRTQHSTGFLLDGRLAIDAGSLTSRLTLGELKRVEQVLLTHSHFDHIKDIPFLVDIMVSEPGFTVDLHGSDACLNALKTDIFNDVIWPNFTRIPSTRKPALRLKPFKKKLPFKFGNYKVRPIPVHHPVETYGFVVSSGTSALGISGDTGPTDELWRVFRETPNLKTILVECSFPNRMQALADLSGHLTPRTLALELKKLGTPLPRILLYHLKPRFEAQIRAEVASLPVRAVREGERYVI